MATFHNAPAAPGQRRRSEGTHRLVLGSISPAAFAVEALTATARRLMTDEGVREHSWTRGGRYADADAELASVLGILVDRARPFLPHCRE